MRISDWSSDVCSSDLASCRRHRRRVRQGRSHGLLHGDRPYRDAGDGQGKSRARRMPGQGERSELPGKTARTLRASTLRDTTRKNGVEGKRLSVLGDIGCRRIIKKTKKTNKKAH